MLRASSFNQPEDAEICGIVQSLDYEIGRPDTRVFLVTLSTFIDTYTADNGVKARAINCAKNQSTLDDEHKKALESVVTTWLDKEMHGARFWPSEKGIKLSHKSDNQM